MKMHWLLTMIFLLFVLVHLYEVGGFQKNVLKNTFHPPARVTIQEPIAEDKPSRYIDGIYYGMADAYRPGLKVKVVIENDMMTQIIVVEHKETQLFFDRSVPVSIEQMLRTQSPDVDGISGATRTVDGLVNAVKQALAQAINE